MGANRTVIGIGGLVNLFEQNFVNITKHINVEESNMVWLKIW